MSRDNLIQRCLLFLAGLFIMAFGVALSVKASLGVSPISCIPYVYSVRFPLTMGEVTILFNILLILTQIAVKRRHYKLFQLIQLPVVIAFGVFTDLTLWMVSDLRVEHYPMQLLLCLLSCIVIGFGVFLEVKARVTYLAGEGLAMALSETFGVEFGKAKIGTDCTMVVGGVVSSFALSGSLLGVREGTVIAAVFVGYVAKAMGRHVTVFDRFVGLEQQVASVADVSGLPAAGPVITLSRQFCSGGREIGQLVADKLGIPFYDRELIRRTAEEAGFTPAYIQEHEQRLAHTLLFSLYEQNYAYVREEMPPLDALFLVQSKVIRELAAKGPCVIVGRCADFVLRDHPGCFNVYVHASDKGSRIRRFIRLGHRMEDADVELDRIDQERINYRKHFTGGDRGLADNYQLTVDSSRLGIERSATLIAEAVSKAFPANASSNAPEPVAPPALA